jgi:hypothetical protein
MRRLFEPCLALAFLMAGCPSDSTKESDAGAAALDGQVANDAQAGDAKATVGTFTIRLVEPVPASGSTTATAGHTTIIGKVWNGPQAEEVVWEVDAMDGPCRLVKPRVPFCDPACQDAVCVEDDQCQASPSERSVGTLTVSGVKTSAGGTEFEVEPIGASYSTPGGVKLPYPAFEEGTEVRVAAPGKDGPGFEVAAKGIAPLELTTTEFPARSTSPLALAWKPAGQPALGTIEIDLDISQHGGTKGKILCEAEDTGSLNIAASLIGKLLKLGVAGFPTISVARVNRATAQTSAGVIELQVISESERPIDIEGLASCSDSSECPDGQTCQEDLTCK